MKTGGRMAASVHFWNLIFVGLLFPLDTSGAIKERPKFNRFRNKTGGSGTLLALPHPELQSDILFVPSRQETTAV
jgi:hypothetical protein